MRIHLIWLIGWLSQLSDAGLTDFLPSFIDFEQLINAATETCERLPLDILFTQQFPAEMRRVELLQYSSGQPGTSGTVIYVPGWWNTPTDESSQVVMSALMAKYREVMMLDTQRAFCRGYLASAARVVPLAHQLYKSIRNMVRQGVPLESIHVVGFSLGAHVAGVTGKLLQQNMNRKLSRITALDPARPCFTRGGGEGGGARVGRRDARFVHVVHTSPVLGLQRPLGHLDLYVPVTRHCQRRGRGWLECSHAAAWRVFARSVRGAGVEAARCRGWGELRAGVCAGEPAAMGERASNTTRGLYLYTMDDPGPQMAEKRRDKVRMENPFNPLSWFTR